ncbi:LysR family transcriptional regulator [Asaia bogorensis]|uniref:LysR family transcriptional regulator n=1 Tax=Asaia bogorensis TaxID=91915 RepID=UPI00301AB34C
MRVEPYLLVVFTAVVESASFAEAARRMGVSRSAVSQAFIRLEKDLDMSLAVRTTHSCILTLAGEELYARVAGPMGEITDAVIATTSKAGPSGSLRLLVSSAAARMLTGPLIAGFCKAYPDIRLDVTVSDAEMNLVTAGFDAGIRIGDDREEGLTALPIGGGLKMMAVASPRFLGKNGRPKHPRDLPRYACIGLKMLSGPPPYLWEFVDQGEALSVIVEPQIMTSDPRLMLRAALADSGIAFGFEKTFRAHIKSGELFSLLDDYMKPHPGFTLYYPTTRYMHPKLRAFLKHLPSSPAA